MAKSSAMWRVSLRSLAAHKVRLGLTVLAVVLGTAFISGAFVFTASLNKAFDGVLSTAYDGMDVVVEAPRDNPEAIDDARVAELEATPGVRAANLSARSSSVIMTGSDGKPIQTGGAPAQGMPFYEADRAVGPATEFRDGTGPRAPDEIAVNATAAERGGVGVGDRVTVVTPSDRADVTISGVYEVDGDVAGWIGVGFTPDRWRELYTDGEHFEQVVIGVDDSATPTEVSDAIAAANPDLDVSTGEALAERDSEQISEALGFVNYFLVAFGLIGLLVGTFIISNTFSMLVAQRTKEFALLRALGASRGQLTRSVVFESIIVGIVGSVLGVLAGFGLSQLLYLAMGSFGFDMPGNGLTASWAAVLVPLIAGLTITVLAAWAPAARAGAVPPVEAMRGGDASSSPKLGVRTIAGLVLAVAALGFIVWALNWDDGTTGARARFVGYGAVASVAAIWLAGPALSIPLVGGLGRLIGAPFGTVGRLAATNSRRNPRRTAATAFALTLGLALVASVGMLGSTMKSAVDGFIDDDFAADYVLTPPMTAQVPMPEGVRDTVAELPEVEDTAMIYFGAASVVDPTDQAAMAAAEAAASGEGPGGPGGASFLDGDYGRWYSSETVAGSLDLASPDAGVVAAESYAAERGWEVGRELTVVTPMGPLQTSLTGIHADGSDGGTLTLSPSILDRAGASRAILSPMQVFVGVDGGAGDATRAATEAGNPDDRADYIDEESVSSARAPIEEAVAGFLVVQVLDREEFGSIASGSIDIMLGIVYALLGLAVVISILGIVNTLALSIIERRQEIGMLRAVGMQRSDIRSMVRLESVQIAIFGAVIGAALGLGLGWSLLTVLADEGLGGVVVPWTLIASMLVGAAVVGVLAAAWPARKAAKTPPLAAIAED
ncbi:ABC transporter permease [uncultured Corynebacterium sp.]|uniref:ABC transporter permease n=1 Tax=uncultured Corynebacterium sp. TaxID=159447 RepID=UPI0025F7D896|nr:ABC transporter permease [uncultured Corynebacterium sp.]